MILFLWISRRRRITFTADNDSVLSLSTSYLLDYLLEHRVEILENV